MAWYPYHTVYSNIIKYVKIMKNITPSAPILWDNLLYLMGKKYGGENQNRLSRDSKVGLATIYRIKGGSTSIGIEVLDKLAGVFGLEAWQIICPLKESEGFTPLSAMALDLGRTLDRIPDPVSRHRAYVVATQVITLGNLSDPTPPAVAAPAPDRASTKKQTQPQ